MEKNNAGGEGGTTALLLWQIHLVKALVVRAGVTRRPATRPAVSSLSGVHLRPRSILPLQEILCQLALQPSIRSGAVPVGTTLLPRPGLTWGHVDRPNNRREAPARLAVLYTNNQGK